MSDEGCVPAIPGMAFVIRVPEKERFWVPVIARFIYKILDSRCP